MSIHTLSIFALLILVFYFYNNLYDRAYRTSENKRQKWLVPLIYSLGLSPINYIVLSDIEFWGEWDKFILTILATLTMWYGANFLKNRDVSAIFRGTETEGDYINQIRFKKVSDFTSRQIPFYVRFTIYQILGEKEYIIFDSSDYSVINKAFGSYYDIQQTFIQGGQFQFSDIIYSTEFVKVDFLSIIDDYNRGHTEIYKGSDTPYNIQVIVKLKKT